MMSELLLENELADVPRPFALIGVGIPGSGKSDALAIVSETLGIEKITPSDIRAQLQESVTDRVGSKRVWRETFSRAETALAAGRSIIVDALHLEAWRRPQDVERYRSYGAIAVVAAVFQTPFSVVQQRNESRERPIPYNDLDRLYRILRKDPPSTAEGFDKIISLRG